MSVGIPLWNRVLGPATRRLPEPARTGARPRLVRALSRPITDALHEVDRLRQLTGKKLPSWSL